MTKRILLAALAGSVVVFLVSSIWHMASGLGEIGIQNLPNEDTVLQTMRSSIHSSGFYFFPGVPSGTTAQAVYLEK
jgi:hypothetical protein